MGTLCSYYCLHALTILLGTDIFNNVFKSCINSNRSSADDVCNVHQPVRGSQKHSGKQKKSGLRFSISINNQFLSSASCYSLCSITTAVVART